MDTSHTPPSLDQLMSIGQLVDYFGTPVSTLYDWRTRGLGPRAYRFGNHLKFSVVDVHFAAAVSGSVTAKARYRDWDGRTRLVQATGATKAQAERKLKAKLRERDLVQSPHSASCPTTL